MSEEKSKYPISDMGDDFQPDAMEDWDARVASGEFDNLSMEQIRAKYVQEEADFVEQQEEAEMYEELNRREEREADSDD